MPKIHGKIFARHLEQSRIFIFPEARVDTGIYNGYQIPPYYDSMLAKLIVHGNNREEAIAKMKSALGEMIIQGVDTNVDYQFEIMNDPDYQKGVFDIGFLESHQIGGVKVNEA